MAKKASAKKQRKLQKKHRKALVRGAEAAAALVASFAAGAITAASRDKLGELAQRVVHGAADLPARLTSTLRGWLAEDDKPKSNGRSTRGFPQPSGRAS